jgi:quercetin dioxygenase-like cupin family protein
MPIIVKLEERRIQQHADGWEEILLADSKIIGSPALAARHWSLEPNVSGPQIEHGDYDEMLYVISGSGDAWVGNQRFSLTAESLLWLEPGDSYQLEAGPEGLEVLQGIAPDSPDER